MPIVPTGNASGLTAQTARLVNEMTGSFDQFVSARQQARRH
jgi:hypothetical protein